MEWYNLLRNISIVGGIISSIIAFVFGVLFMLVLKSDKYKNKTVEETPLLKYSTIILIGMIFVTLFMVILELIK